MRSTPSRPRTLALRITLAAALLTGVIAAVAVAAATPGTYTGRSAAKLPVRLTVAPNGKAVSYSLQWVAVLCDGGVRGSRYRDSAVGRNIAIKANGSFSLTNTYTARARWGRQPARARIRATFSGRFTGRRVRGDFRASVQIFQRGRRTHTCDTVEDNAFNAVRR